MAASASAAAAAGDRGGDGCIIFAPITISLSLLPAGEENESPDPGTYPSHPMYTLGPARTVHNITSTCSRLASDAANARGSDAAIRTTNRYSCVRSTVPPSPPSLGAAYTTGASTRLMTWQGADGDAEGRAPTRHAVACCEGGGSECVYVDVSVGSLDAAHALAGVDDGIAAEGGTPSAFRRHPRPLGLGGWPWGGCPR